MPEHPHRYLSRTDVLPLFLQQYLNRTGDHWTRYGLFGRPDLDPGLLQDAIRNNDADLVEAWSRYDDREPDELLSAAPLLTSDNARANLARQKRLPASLLNDLLEHPTSLVAWTLLSRPDLPDGSRGPLTTVYLSACTPSEDHMARTDVRGLLGDHPDALTAALRDCPQHAHGLLNFLPITDDPALHDAAVGAIRYLADGPGLADSSRKRCVTLAARRLLASPFLDPQHGYTLLQIATLHELDVAERIDERLQLDGPVLMRNLSTCNDTADHIDALGVLLDNSSLLEVDRELVAVEAIRHHDCITGRQLDKAVSLSRGTLIAGIVRTIEESEGSASVAVQVALTSYGAFATTHLVDPIPAVRALAQRGWAALAGHQMDPRIVDTVLEHFAPVHVLTHSPELAQAIVEVLDQAGPDVGETAVALLPEWVGTLPDLMSAARQLTPARST